MSICELAQRKSNHGGLGWYGQLYCQGIHHYCATIAKIGGMLPDLVKPQHIDGVDWSWLYVVMGRAIIDSNAAGSNVLKSIRLDQQPVACCEEWHEQAQNIQPGESLQYSFSRKSDTAAQQLLPGTTASLFPALRVSGEAE